MNKQLTKKLMAVFIMILVSVTTIIPEFPVYAAGVETYNISVPYRQTEARSMLEMVNDFRTGPDAWQWNSSDTKKEKITGLSELQYDYALERAAMQRAVELVVGYSHTRPNGETCFTACEDSYMAYGENIAIGTSNMTAETAFRLWQETDEPYAGQGHRRNMLSANFGAFAVAHVYYNGCHYWVQEFGDRPLETGYTEPCDSEQTMAVEILSSNITDRSCSAIKDSYSMNVGDTADLPALLVNLRTSDTWSYAPAAPSSLPCTEWTSSAPECVSVSGGTMTALQSGKATLSTKAYGQTIKVSVTVSQSTTANPDSVTITETSYLLKYSAKKQRIKLNVLAAAGKIKYSSDNPKVKVNKSGTVTIAKKFRGDAVITVKVTAKNSKPVTKKISIRVE